MGSVEISYSKARKLTILTREPETPTVVPGRKEDGTLFAKGSEPAPRTDRYYEQIRAIANDPTITDESEVANLVGRVRAGEDLEKAKVKAAVETAVEKTRQAINKGSKKIEELAEELKQRNTGSDEILKASINLYRKIASPSSVCLCFLEAFNVKPSKGVGCECPQLLSVGVLVLTYKG